MKRLYCIPAILLLAASLLLSTVVKGQQYFKVDVKGTGTPVILIHGLYCTGDVWAQTVERYQRDHECHVLTLAGFGGVAPNLNDHFLESVKDDVIAYVKAKKLKNTIIIGHSMGGYLAYWLAATEPSLFKSVIAVDGLPYFPVLQMPAITPESAKEMASNIKSGMANLTPEQTVANQKMYLPTMIADQQHIDEVAAMAAKCDAATIAEVMYEMYTIDLRPEVEKITVPVLLLGSWIGYKNYGVTHDSALAGYTAQVKSAKNATVALSDTAKHFIFFDDPSWFFEKADPFVK